MAKINLPRRTVFSQPGAIRELGPAPGVGLKERIQAQQARDTGEGIVQGLNLLTDLAGFGVDIARLQDQKSSGEFEVAKANAESRWESEMQVATDPEPLINRVRSPEGTPLELVGAPLDVLDDEELFVERFRLFQDDILELGNNLKGSAKKKYDVWVATQANDWGKGLAGAYNDRIVNGTNANYTLATNTSVRKGNPTEVQRLWQERIDKGLVRFEDVAEKMNADIEEAYLTWVTATINDIGNRFGFATAAAALDTIHSKDPEIAKLIDSGILSQKQIEGVRDVVQQRVADQIANQKSVYENITKPRIEEDIQKAVFSYGNKVPGWNPETGQPATEMETKALIQTSDLLPEDKQSWLNTTEAITKALKKGDPSDERTKRQGVEFALNNAITPDRFKNWITEMGGLGRLNGSDMMTLLAQKQKWFGDSNLRIASEVVSEQINQQSINEIQGEQAMAEVEAWINTGDGGDALRKDPFGAVKDKAQSVTGEMMVHDFLLENTGVKFSETEEARRTSFFANVRRTREAQGRINPDVPMWDLALQISGAPEKQTFYQVGLVPEDQTFIDIIRDRTGITVDAWGQNELGVEGYIANTDVGNELFDVFQVTDKKGEVLYWDANDNKWRKYKKEGKFQKERGFE